MATKVYTLDEINKISIDNITLPNETHVMIDILSNSVGANTYSKTPVFVKKKEIKRKEPIATLKKTEMVVNEGIDKTISELRSLLNKLTNINYEKIIPKIQKNIQLIIDTNDETHINKICNFIFDTASSNKFYSEIYATLYGSIISEYNILKNILDNNINTYLELFENIELVDPNEDYDRFCKVNVINEKRKATSLFITNLMKNETIDVDIVLNMLSKLHTLLENNLDSDNKKVVEEIIENIYLIVTTGMKKIKDNLCDFEDKFNTMRDKPGLSNKAMFKYMDLIDIIKQN